MSVNIQQRVINTHLCLYYDGFYKPCIYQRKKEHSFESQFCCLELKLNTSFYKSGLPSIIWITVPSGDQTLILVRSLTEVTATNYHYLPQTHNLSSCLKNLQISY